MKEFTWSPQDKEDDNGKKVVAVFKGSVKLKIPKYRERLKLIKDMQFKVSPSGEVEQGSSAMDNAIQMVELVDKHVTSLKLSKKDCKHEFSTVADLEYDKEGSELINEMANVILGGISLGK